MRQNDQSLQARGAGAKYQATTPANLELFVILMDFLGLLKIRKFLGIGNGPLGLTTDCGKNSLMCFYYQSKVLVNNLGPMERL